MVDACRELDLAPETFDAQCARELWGQHLHDDAAVEGALLRDEDARHSAATQLPIEPVGIAERGLKLVAKISDHGKRQRGTRHEKR
jgi:hypothetical protein